MLQKLTALVIAPAGLFVVADDICAEGFEVFRIEGRVLDH